MRCWAWSRARRPRRQRSKRWNAATLWSPGQAAQAPRRSAPPAAAQPPPAGLEARIACSPCLVCHLCTLQAYRKLALLKHPDKNPDNPRAADEFAALQKAYELLLDAEARAALDGLLK